MGLTVIAEGMVPPELVRVPDEWNFPDLGKIDIRLFKIKICGHYSWSWLVNWNRRLVLRWYRLEK